MRPKRGGWELIVYQGRDPVTKKKRYPSKMFHGGKRAAQRELARLVAEADNRPGTEHTLAELLDRYLAEQKRLGRSPATLYTYRNYIKNHIDPRDERGQPVEGTLGPVELRKLTAEHLDRFYATLQAVPLATSTVRQCHAILSGALDLAARWGWVKDNPAKRARVPAARSAEVVPPTVDEVIAFLSLAEQGVPTTDEKKGWAGEPTTAAFLFAAATTGARRGELCALRWRDVKLDERKITLRHSLLDVPGSVREAKDTKTHQMRQLALDDATIAALTEYKAILEREYGGPLAPDRFVFAMPDGEAMRPDFISKRVQRLRDELDLQHLTLKSFRHFVATQAVAGGHHQRMVAGRLGHSGGGAITMRVYAHFAPTPDAAIAEDIGRQLTRGKT